MLYRENNTLIRENSHLQTNYQVIHLSYKTINMGIVLNYFNFSRKEGIAALVLAVIITPLAMLPFLNKTVGGEIKAGDNNWVSVSNLLDNNDERAVVYSELRGNKRAFKNSGRVNVSNARLFSFDPNTATPDDLLALGLREKTVQIICNYRNKGGKFRDADDLKKIYGLQPEEFERLKPFISISATVTSNKLYYTKNENTTFSSAPQKEYKRRIVAIDVNSADTIAYQSLYGIGSKLAARIVSFRNKLGGFYSVDQVGETYGVPDSTFQKIKPYLKLNYNGIDKMNINSATYDELNAHPYISSKLAYLIMKYRKDNGNFANLDKLKELISQTNDSFEKVVNYLTL